MNWQPINLAAPQFAEPTEPPHIAGLLYRGLRHVISGPPEAAKTLLALILTLEAIRETESRIGHVDLEMGPKRTRGILDDLGATEADLRGIEYFEPADPPTAIDLDQIATLVDLVTIDAAAGAYNVSGLDDNARKDVEQFAATWVDPLYRHGVGTLLIDHVTKSVEGRGKFAIGSERKAGQADVHLGLELVGQPLTRGGKAVVKVHVHKDRPGWLKRPYACELALNSDPETHRISWEWREAASTLARAGGLGWRPTIHMERVSVHLERHGPMSRSAIYKAGLGRRETLVTAVDCLVREGNLTHDGSHLVPSIPFRHDQAGSLIPKPFPTVPGTTDDTGSHGSHPYRGGTGNGNHSDEELARLEALGEQMGLA
jgi:hypothetical protein